LRLRGLTCLGTIHFRRQNNAMGYHLVRYSLLGHVGRFVAAEAVRYPRNTRVVVRSPRGLEIGEVLAVPELADSTEISDGQILRRVTVEDDLLSARLEKHRHEAFIACCDLLATHQVPAVLVDVEHLFDGQGLFFYFLGEVPTQANSVMQQLADIYETTVEFRKFAETLTEGCGPGCGTEEAKGQGGCASCTSCAVASACGTRK
jgi:cell fate regulator YaaT (PSP1 superfamily)